MKKTRKKIEIIRLEERVLFDAAAAAAVVEAAEQQQDLLDQQQQQQEQLQKQAEQQEQQQEQAQTPQENAEIAGAQNNANSDAQAESAHTADDGADADGAERSDLGNAVDAMSNDDDVTADEDSDVSDAEALQESVDAAAAEHTDAAIEALINGDDAEDAEESEDAIAPAVDDAEAETSALTVAQEDTDTLAEEAAGLAPDAENTVGETGHHELAIISNTVQDQDTLISQLAEGTDVLVLNDSADVLDQINDYLDQQDHDYDAIHILSHGGNGYFSLNDTRIDMQALADDPASFAAIGEHLTDNGDILLYGCNIASGEEGQAFASQLASLTGADVAASTSKIGLTGGWDLDYSTGLVDVTAFSANDYAYNMLDVSYTVAIAKKGSYTDGKVGDVSYVYSTELGDDPEEQDFEYGRMYVSTNDGKSWNAVEGEVGTLDWVVSQSMGHISDNVTVTVDKGTGLVKGLSGYIFIVDMQESESGADDGYKVVGNWDLGDNVLIIAGGNHTVAAKQTITANGIYILNVMDTDGETVIAEGNLTVNAGGNLSLTSNSVLSVINANTDPARGNVWVASVREPATGIIVSGDSFSGGEIKVGSDITLNGTASMLTGEGTVFSSGSLTNRGEFSLFGGNYSVMGAFNNTGTVTANVVLEDGDNSSFTNTGKIKGDPTSGDIFINRSTHVTLTDADLGPEKISSNTVMQYLFAENGAELLSAIGTAGAGGSISNVISLTGETYALDEGMFDVQKTTSVTDYYIVTAQDTNDIQSQFSIGSGATVYFGYEGLGRANIEFADLSLTDASAVVVGKIAADNISATGTDSILLADGSSLTWNGSGTQAADLSNADLTIGGSGNVTLTYTKASGDTLTQSGIVVADGSSLSISGRSIRLKDFFIDVNEGGALSVDGRISTTGKVDFILSGSFSDTEATRYTVSSNSTLTLGFNEGVASENVTVKSVRGSMTVSKGGTLELAGRNANFSGEANTARGIKGAGGIINISGDNMTFNCNVGLDSNGGALNVYGDNLVFNYHFTNAWGWYSMNDRNGYNAVDDSDYVFNINNQAGEALTATAYTGVINIGRAGNEAGVVLFNGQVVSVNDFTINSGVLTFSGSRLVAAAAGNFTIKGGTVNFDGNVYVTAIFNGDLAGTGHVNESASDPWARDTVFTIDGGIVYFNRNLENRVRTYRGGYTGSGDKKASFGDMHLYMTQQGMWSDLEFRRAMTSSVIFNGGQTFFGDESTLNNYGVFGEVNLTVNEGASVKFYTLNNIQFNAYEPAAASKTGPEIDWSTKWQSTYGSTPFVGSYQSATLTIEGLYTGGIKNGASLNFNAAGTIIVAGDLLNSGNYSSFGRAEFLINESSDNNKYSGSVTNTDGALLNIWGAGNHFASLISSDASETFVHTDTANVFTSVTNSSHLQFTDTGATQIDFFTNSGSGETTIDGVNSGFHFIKQMNITGGKVRISSAFGVDVFADITLSSSSFLQITAKNKLTGDIVNNGAFSFDGRGITMTGSLTNNAGGQIDILDKPENTGENLELTVISGKVVNAGLININQAGLTFNPDGAGFSNSGKIAVNKYSLFNNLQNLKSGKLTLGDSTTEAAGTVFVNLVNSGNIRVTVSGIVFSDGLTNLKDGELILQGDSPQLRRMIASNGTLLFVNEGNMTISANFSEDDLLDLNNSGTLKLEGAGSGQIFNFGRLKNTGTIEANALATVNVRGDLEHDGNGVFQGAVKSLSIYANAFGTGNFAMPTGSVTYNYSETAAARVDSDGFWRVNGQLLTDADGNVIADSYSNRPVYVKGTGWCKDSTGTEILSENTKDLSRFSDVTVDENGQWCIGLVCSGVNAVKINAEPVINGTVWSYNGKDSTVKAEVRQGIFGGTLLNLTIEGEAKVGVGADAVNGVSVSGVKLEVNGDFTDKGIRLLVDGEKSSIVFRGKKYDDTQTGSSLWLTNGGTVTFDASDYPQGEGQGEIRKGFRLSGAVRNEGTIEVAAYKSLTFKNGTRGDGVISADNGYVTYASDAAGFSVDKTYYTADKISGEYVEVTNPKDDDFASYYEAIYTQAAGTFDSQKTYYRAKEVEGKIVYEKVTDARPEEFSTYLDRHFELATEIVYGSAEGSVYYDLTIAGSGKRGIISAVDVNFLHNNADLTVTDTALSILRGATDSVAVNGAAITLAGKSTLTATVGEADPAYTINSKLTVGKDSAASITGTAVKKIAWNGKVVNAGSLTASNVDFGEVVNTGTAVLVDGIRFSSFAQDGGTMTILSNLSTHVDTGSGNYINELTQSGGEIIVGNGNDLSATLTLKGSVNLTAITVNAGSMLAVEVGDGGVVSLGAADHFPGTAGETSWGIKLYGDLTVSSGTVTIYGYADAATPAKPGEAPGSSNSIITLKNSGHVVLADDSGLSGKYGDVYALVVGKTNENFTDEGGRHQISSAWVIIDKSTTYSELQEKGVEGTKFLVQNGATFTVDVAMNAGGTGDYALQVLENSKVVFQKDARFTDIVVLAQDSRMTLEDGSSVTFSGDNTLTVDGAISGSGNIIIDSGMTLKVGEKAGVTMTDGTFTYGAHLTGDKVIAGTYATLAVYSEMAAASTITVNKNLKGSGTLTFNGETAGNATVLGDDRTEEYLNVVYSSKAAVVYGGTYGNLSITGDRKLTEAITVKNDFTLDNAVITGSAPLSLGKTVTAVNSRFGGTGTDAVYTGLVTYGNAGGGTVVRGYYGTVDSKGNFDGGLRLVSGTWNINSSVMVGGAFTLEGSEESHADIEIGSSGILTLGEEGVQTKSQVSDTQYNNIANRGNLIFNSTNMGNLKVKGDGVKSAIVNSGIMTVNAQNDFRAITQEKGTLEFTEGADGSYIGKFAKIAGNFIGSQYVKLGTMIINPTGTLTITSTNIPEFETLLNFGTIDITMDGSDEAKTTEFWFDGERDLTNYGTLKVNAGTVYLVNFQDETIYEKESYSPVYTIAEDAVLAFTGKSKDTTLSGTITNNGTISADIGNRELVFNGITRGAGFVASSGDLDAVYAAGNIYAFEKEGSYGTLKITGLKASADSAHNADEITVNDRLLVDAGAKAEFQDIVVNGTISGNGVITFNGATSGSGSVDIGDSTTSRIVYGTAAETIYSGTYYDLEFKGGDRSVDGDLTVSHQLIVKNGTISGSGNWFFANTNAAESTAKLENTGKVTYGYADAESKTDIAIFNGTYKNLELNGNITLSEKHVVTGTISGIGDIDVIGQLSASKMDMGDGSKVTYESYSGDMITGSYYDLVDNSTQAAPVVTEITVRNVYTGNGLDLKITETGKFTVQEMENVGDIEILSGGKMIFSSNKEDYIFVTSAISNQGTLNVDKGSYAFLTNISNKEGGKFIVKEGDGEVILLSFENCYGADADFAKTTLIVELLSGWVNYGNLSVSNFSNFGFEKGTELALVNTTAAKLTVANGIYTFDNTTALVNGGTVTAGKNAVVTFETLNERQGGTAAYVTAAGGTMNFNVAEGTAVNDGVRGSLTNGGTMNLNSAYMKYYGTVSNQGSSDNAAVLNVNALSIFEGALSKNTYGAVEIHDKAAGTVFQNTVSTGSVFVIAGATTFNKMVSAGGIFQIGAETIFGADVSIGVNDSATSSVGDANTIFDIYAKTLFNGNVEVKNSASEKPWNVVVNVYAASTFNGKLTVDAETGSSHLAQFFVRESAGFSSFNEIENLGSGAQFIVYSSNNSFLGTFHNGITKTTVDEKGESHTTTVSGGLFELNGVNQVGVVENIGSAYFRINNGASGSTVGAVTNSGKITVFAGNFGEATEVSFNGEVVNRSGGTIAVNAAGVHFGNTISNAGTFDVNAALIHSLDLTNTGTFNINAGNSYFSGNVNNNGTMKIAQDAAGVKFTGLYTIREKGDLYLGGVDTVLSAVVNSGTIHVTGGLDSSESTPGNVIDNLTMDSQVQSTMLISASGELTLGTVTDNYHGTVSASEYWIVTTVSSGGTTVINQEKMTDAQIEAYKEGTFPPENTETTKYTVEKRTVYVDGTQPKILVANGGLLRFDDSVTQTIYSDISVTGDSDVMYDPSRTTFEKLDYVDWTMVYNSSQISGAGKYRIMGGANVSLREDASGSLVRVMQGGTLNLNTSSLSSLVNRGGSVNVNGGTYGILLENQYGTMTVNSGSGTLNIENSSVSTLKISGSGLSVRVVNNGEMIVSGADNLTAVSNNGSLEISGSGNMVDLTLNSGVVAVNADSAIRGVNAGVIRVADNKSVTISGFSDTAAAVLAIGSGSTAVFADAQTLAGSFAAGTGSVVNGNLTANGAFNAGSKLTVNGNLTVNGTVAGSNADFKGDVTYSGAQSVISGNYYSALNGGSAVNNGTVNTYGRTELSSNSGTLNAYGNVTLDSNRGTLNVNGNSIAAAVDASSGKLAVNGNSVSLTGHNSGSVDVNGSAYFNMISDKNAEVNINGSATVSSADAFSGRITNNGTINLYTAVTALNGSIDNNGTINANVSNAVDAIFNDVAVDGATVNLNATADLDGKTIAQGATVGIGSSGVSLDSLTNNGMLVFRTGGYLLNDDFAGSGTVGVDSGVTLTLAGSEFAGKYQVDGTLALTAGSTRLSGSLINNGTISANDVIFSGSNSGYGIVNADSAIYEETAKHLFGGRYGMLTVNSEGLLDSSASVGSFLLNGTLATAKNAVLTLNGVLRGEGLMAGGEGTVIYNGTDQRLFGGVYHNLTILGSVAVIDKDLEITGDAVNGSGQPVTAGINTRILYSGSRNQQVMAANYGILELKGSGTKLMENYGNFEINSFEINPGDYYGSFVEVASSGNGRWNLDAENIDIHVARISDVNALRTYYLDGTNFQGTNNSANWLVFYAGSNVGETAPSMENANFNALSQYFYQERLQQMNSHELFSRHEQMESARNIMVRDMAVGSDISLNAKYDMIDFGNDGWSGLSLAEDEAGEILKSADAVSDSFDDALAEMLK